MAKTKSGGSPPTGTSGWFEKALWESDWEPKAPALAEQTAEWAKKAPDLMADARAALEKKRK